MAITTDANKRPYPTLCAEKIIHDAGIASDITHNRKAPTTGTTSSHRSRLVITSRKTVTPAQWLNQAHPVASSTNFSVSGSDVQLPSVKAPHSITATTKDAVLLLFAAIKPRSDSVCSNNHPSSSPSCSKASPPEEVHATASVMLSRLNRRRSANRSRELYSE
ncbi:hypothetical protein ON010_g1789 [Phytophthora cinnamomi]|nr:hypothetical protein ON010_g1789 [Phytophthora cinnamomi]